MRVISGRARGLKLISPEGIETRPTLDRVKEALFSMLFPYLNDSVVLDLFAGSGALGIEALSRGALKCFFVDNSEQAVSCVKKNVSGARVSESSEIIKTNALDFVKRSKEKFDIIFLDPPYQNDIYNDIIDSIAKKELLKENGLVVIEWDYINEPPFKNNAAFEIFREKKYGRVGITVLKRR